MATKKDLEKLFDKLINGIDVKENTEWGNSTKEISENIRDALINQINKLRPDRDAKFLDYCNAVKSLLAIYNFGALDTDDDSETENPDIDIIIDGVRAILDHVKAYGYDISEKNRDIFITEERKEAKVTMSATAVFTTLVYFRRAYKRKKLFSDDQLNINGENLMARVIGATSAILVMFVKYIEANGYKGWGFTFDSRAVRLSDTYAVVDAISRFQDAFTKDSEEDKLNGKNDEEFIKKIREYTKEKFKEEEIVDRCLGSMYKTAFNIYDESKDVYGRSVFYVSAEEGRDNKICNVYSRTDYDQIANSNRSSALFNPLYVAMITMYGYNDKEIVIRRFMDDYELTKKYYKRYETDLKKESGHKKITISHYATILGGLKPVEYPEPLDEKDRENEKKVKAYEEKLSKYREYSDKYKKAVQKFNNDLETLEMLKVRDKKWSDDYSDNNKWRARYDLARVFQKYLETQEPEELMKISDYRDYFNATKDAIDQVQIMYRDFDNSQRLSVVDTDYVMFTALDIRGAHSEYISKLNKANISVNYLRPLLLSSRIMIVNALTKYPQADLEELYNAIIESQYHETVDGERKRAWLWNADGIDMNSTARHCETITYDYFYYYENYELVLKAIKNLKKNIGGAISEAFDKTTGAVEVDKVLATDEMVSFKHVALHIASQNANSIKDKYKNKILELQADIQRLNTEKERLVAKHEQDIRELKEKYAVSINIGDTMRSWIREETDRHFTDMLSMIILGSLNSMSNPDVFTLKRLMGEKGDKKLYWAGFDSVKDLVGKLRDEYSEDPQATADRYEPDFKRAFAMQTLFNGAFDGIIERAEFKNVKDQKRVTDKDGNPIDINEELANYYRDCNTAKVRDQEYPAYLDNNENEDE